MEKYNKKAQDIMLAFGIIFFLAGIVLFFLLPIGERETYHLVLNTVFLLITAFLVYFSLLARNAVSFYISLNLCIISLLFLILTAHAVPLAFSKHWPLLVITFGVTLLPVGRIHYKKFRTAYVFPSAAMTVLGVFFFLFTLKIIKVPMRVFLGKSMPIFLAFCGAFLIALYYVRQNAKEKFPIIKDDEEKYNEEYESEDYE